MHSNPAFSLADLIVVFGGTLSCLGFSDERASTSRWSEGLPLSVDASEIPLDRPDCAKRDAPQFFFPAGVLFPERPEFEGDAFLRAWFSRALERMGEPSLSCNLPTVDTYRLLVLPTWGPPLAIRIGMAPPNPSVTVTELNGKGGYDPGTIARRATSTISEPQRQSFVDALAKADFWAAATIDYDRRGVDGTEWILEGRAGETYHVVHRWSPDTGTFHDLCMVTMDVAGVRAITD
jgi:hypothetical protein